MFVLRHYVFGSESGAAYCSAECRKNAAEARVTERRMLADGRSRSGSENARAIAEINRRARAAGLSYGKYLAYEKYVQA